jgi:beta-xylosidase
MMKAKECPMALPQILAYCNPILTLSRPDPFILRAGGVYYLFASKTRRGRWRIPIHRSADLVHWELFYSTGSWGKPDYGVRWSVGESPLGPFVEQPDVLLASTREVKGPGHHNFFTGLDGDDWIVYHGWDPAMTRRMTRIDRLIWRDGRPTTDGPTSTPQRMDGHQAGRSTVQGRGRGSDD